MFEGLAGLAELGDDGEPVYLDAVRSFIAKRYSGGLRRLLDQIVEDLEVNLRLATSAHDTSRPAVGALTPR